MKSKFFYLIALLGVLVTGCVKDDDNQPVSLSLIGSREPFLQGEVREFKYSLPDGTLSDIDVTSIPHSWGSEINRSNKTIKVTAPPKFFGYAGNMTVTVKCGDKISYTTVMLSPAVGTPIFEYNNYFQLRGYVVSPKTESSNGVAVALLNDYSASWCLQSFEAVCTDMNDGIVNAGKILSSPNYNTNDYPAYAHVFSYFQGWYLPAANELKNFMTNTPEELLNKLVRDKANKYWSSTEVAGNNDNVYQCDCNGNLSLVAKTTSSYLLPFCQF